MKKKNKAIKKLVACRKSVKFFTWYVKMPKRCNDRGDNTCVSMCVCVCMPMCLYVVGIKHTPCWPFARFFVASRKSLKRQRRATSWKPAENINNNNNNICNNNMAVQYRAQLPLDIATCDGFSFLFFFFWSLAFSAARFGRLETLRMQSETRSWGRFMFWP